MFNKILKHLIFIFSGIFLSVVISVFYSFFNACNIDNNFAATIYEIFCEILEFFPLTDITKDMVSVAMTPQSYIDFTVVKFLDNLIGVLFLGFVVTIFETLKIGSKKSSSVMPEILGLITGALFLAVPQLMSDILALSTETLFLIIAVVIMIVVIKSRFSGTGLVTFIISRTLLVIINALISVILSCYFVILSNIMVYNVVENTALLSKILTITITVFIAYGGVEVIKYLADKIDKNNWKWI